MCDGHDFSYLVKFDFSYLVKFHYEGLFRIYIRRGKVGHKATKCKM